MPEYTKNPLKNEEQKGPGGLVKQLPVYAKTYPA